MPIKRIINQGIFYGTLFCFVLYLLFSMYQVNLNSIIKYLIFVIVFSLPALVLWVFRNSKIVVHFNKILERKEIEQNEISKEKERIKRSQVKIGKHKYPFDPYNNYVIHEFSPTIIVSLRLESNATSKEYELKNFSVSQSGRDAFLAFDFSQNKHIVFSPENILSFVKFKQYKFNNIELVLSNLLSKGTYKKINKLRTQFLEDLEIERQKSHR